MAKTKKTPKPFWKDGIRFECQGSGKCCTSRGSYGYVYFTLEDRKRAAAHLGIPVAEFTRKYLERSEDGQYYIREPEKDCLFMEERRCTIYEGRPTQCRTWPFWPENMNARTWSREIATFCPGVGKGRLYTREEILELLDQDPTRREQKAERPERQNP